MKEKFDESNLNSPSPSERSRLLLQEYTDILRSQTFPGEACNLIAHDYSFWFGDLNFRLNDVTMEQLKEAIKNDSVMPMLEHDQVGESATEN